MTPEFEEARERLLDAQLDLARALKELRSTIPMDDQSSFDRETESSLNASDDLMVWLAQYGRPYVDPALVVEDLVD